MSDFALAKPMSARPQMRPSEIILALKLSRDGLTQTEIAKRLQRDQSTISDLLGQWQDNRELAQVKLHTGALKLAERVIEHADVEQSLDVLERIEVIAPKQAQFGLAGVQINVGMPGQPAGPDPLSPVNVISNYQTQRQLGSQSNQALTANDEGERAVENPGESQT